MILIRDMRTQLIAWQLFILRPQSFFSNSESVGAPRGHPVP